MTKLVLSALLFFAMANKTFASVPTLAQTFDTNVTTYDMTSTQANKITEAEGKIKAIIASDEFRNAVLNFTYNGKKQFLNNKGLTNSQIYTKILQGSELKYPTNNNRMDMGVKLYTDASTTIGWTNVSLTYINMNRKYFDSYTSSQVAHNMMHEWMHKLGFDHAANYTPSRDSSVPYAIGYIVLKMAPRY